MFFYCRTEGTSGVIEEVAAREVAAEEADKVQAPEPQAETATPTGPQQPGGGPQRRSSSVAESVESPHQKFDIPPSSFLETMRRICRICRISYSMDVLVNLVAAVVLSLSEATLNAFAPYVSTKILTDAVMGPVVDGHHIGASWSKFVEGVGAMSRRAFHFLVHSAKADACAAMFTSYSSWMIGRE